MGMTAQCRPKITRICHMNPIRIPNKTGEAANREANPVLKRLVATDTTGPMSKNPAAMETTITAKGTKKSLEHLRNYFFLLFSAHNPQTTPQ